MPKTHIIILFLISITTVNPLIAKNPQDEAKRYGYIESLSFINKNLLPLVNDEFLFQKDSLESMSDEEFMQKRADLMKRIDLANAIFQKVEKIQKVKGDDKLICFYRKKESFPISLDKIGEGYGGLFGLGQKFKIIPCDKLRSFLSESHLIKNIQQVMTKTERYLKKEKKKYEKKWITRPRGSKKFKKEVGELISKSYSYQSVSSSPFCILYVGVGSSTSRSIWCIGDFIDGHGSKSCNYFEVNTWTNTMKMLGTAEFEKCSRKVLNSRGVYRYIRDYVILCNRANKKSKQNACYALKNDFNITLKI